MFSSDMTLVIRVVQKIGEAIGQPVSVHRSTWPDVSYRPIAGNANPLRLFTAGFNDQRTSYKSIARRTPHHRASPEEKMHIFKEIQSATKESLNNVANSAPKALQAAFKLQWPRSADITDTLLVRNIIGNSTKENSWLINSPI